MDEFAKQFTYLAGQYGPSVADAAKAAARMEAYSTLVGGLLAAAIAFVCMYAATWVHRQKDWNEEWMIASSIGWIVGGIALCFAVWAWVDPWTWTAISHPELWLAKKAFNI